MSGSFPTPEKPSRGQRLFARLTARGRSSSRSISPSSQSSQIVSLSTAQTTGSSSTHDVSSSIALAGHAVPALSTVAAASPPSPSATSTSPSSELLDNVLKRLSESDRAILQTYKFHNTGDVDSALEQALKAAKEKQECCLEKRWTFEFRGRTVVLREKAEKVVGWLNKFKAVGDIAANVDPMHVGLPWAGIRLLLEASVSEANQMKSLLIGCEIALYMANRLKAYIEFLHQLPPTLTRSNLEAAVIELYAHILQFLAGAIRIYQTSTTHRALRAFWTDGDISDFERTCEQLGNRVEIEASNCDRTLGAQDRELIWKLKRDLQKELEALRGFHKVQESLNRLETKTDLDKLPFAKGVMYNSYKDDPHEDDFCEGDYTTCLPNTRVDLLQEIYDWAQHPESKSIFWLSGGAGTGKSTISRTVAGWLDGQGGPGSPGGAGLGASFFFKRGEGDRGSASRFFPTIAHQLVLKVAGLDAFVAKMITQDPLIHDKALGEQFDKLIYQPLHQIKLNTNPIPTLVVVVDALDECGKEQDVKTIINLWSRLARLTTICLRLLLTSRPDLPVQLGFKDISTDLHQEIILQDAVPQTTIQHDIQIFLEHAFGKIRYRFNREDSLSGADLNEDWPGDEKIQTLINMATPLFIVAATIYRFVNDRNWDPQEQLDIVLKSAGVGQLEQIARTYRPVLIQLSARVQNPRDKDRLYEEFRIIVGSIVCLAEPLSRQALAALLNVPPDMIIRRLRPLNSVLRIPSSADTPIRTLHLSFSEFLTSEQLQAEPFGVSKQTTHYMLLSKCLQLLSGPRGLRENICGLEYPGKLRRELGQDIISNRLSPALQYACQYWVRHLAYSEVEIHDQDDTHMFLQKHFLHWLEAMSFINRLASVIEQIRTLQSLVSSKTSTYLSDFLHDAQRIILANRHFVDLAPLQIYSAAMIFAPQTSVVRNICGRVPAWIKRAPITEAMWNLELQKLEGHTNWISAVAFSPDNSLLVSASYDRTVRLWNPATGQEVQRLEGTTDIINGVAFSLDGLSLASALGDNTVQLWNLATGYQVQKLEGHTNSVRAVVFSPDGSLLASASADRTLRLWNLVIGQEVQKLEGHTDCVTALIFSSDGLLLASASADRTLRLWNLATGQEVQKLEGHTDWIRAIAFSQDSLLLASASDDQTIRLWNPAITSQEVQKLEGHTDWVIAVVFLPDGSLLASASNDRTIRLWNLVMGQEVQKLEGHTDQIRALAISSDGSLLASASADQTIRLWNPAITGKEVQKLEGPTNSVAAVAFSPDGLLFASALYNGTARLWHLATGQVQKFDGHTHPVSAVAFSSDVSLLASGSTDGTVQLWKLPTGEVQKFDGHTDRVTTVAFSSDSSLLTSGSIDGTIRLWRLLTGQVQELEGHNDRVTVAAFSSDGSLLASGSIGGTVRLWKLPTGQVQKLEGHVAWIGVVAFSPDGSLLASTTSTPMDKTVRLWNLAKGQEVQKFESLNNITAIRFVNNNAALLTNQGLLSIENESLIVSTPTSSSNKTVAIHNNWIQQNGFNLLWLPQEYRAALSAFQNNIFAFALTSDQVCFLSLDYDTSKLVTKRTVSAVEAPAT